MLNRANSLPGLSHLCTLTELKVNKVIQAVMNTH